MEQITFVPTFSGWQAAARRALAQHHLPEQIVWEELGREEPGLPLFDESIGNGRSSRPVNETRFRVPRAFVEMAERVACHRDPRRWALLYRALWRLTHGESQLLEMVVDSEVNELMRMDKAVRHDLHKMRAFVRFRAVPHGSEAWYVAWFEPEHNIVEKNAPFFRDRFATMRWSILTPVKCAHWDGEHLSFTPGVAKSEAPTEDSVEKLWRTYYGHIFNPARVKIKAMQAEMPKRYWKNLPEAVIIPKLLEEAPARVEKMLVASKNRSNGLESGYGAAQPPATADWESLNKAARICHACPLWQSATQTVFGEGPYPAEVMLVGEQPGDIEDRIGRPFVGPAGKLLDQALAESGVDRSRLYITNAVKHFKWEPRGKRRIHQTPNSRDVSACLPWLEAEVRLVQPRVLVCLGSTAAIAIFGPNIRVLRDRGQFRVSTLASQTLITFHPSALLRAPDPALRETQYRQFVDDLRLAFQGLS